MNGRKLQVKITEMGIGKVVCMHTTKTLERQKEILLLNK